MATPIRNTDPSLAYLVDAVNDLKTYCMTQLRLARADIATIAVDSDIGVTPTFLALGFHNDKSEVTVTADDPDGTLPIALALVNQILEVYKFHMADTCAHKTTGLALASYVHATTLATAITRANDVKAKFNTHRASTTYHYTADTTNDVTASDATDQSSLDTLLDDLKTQLNAHMASGPAAKSLRLVGA